MAGVRRGFRDARGVAAWRECLLLLQAYRRDVTIEPLHDLARGQYGIGHKRRARLMGLILLLLIIILLLGGGGYYGYRSGYYGGHHYGGGLGLVLLIVILLLLFGGFPHAYY